jgi:hypothetical protein
MSGNYFCVTCLNFRFQQHKSCENVKKRVTGEIILYSFEGSRRCFDTLYTTSVYQQLLPRMCTGTMQCVMTLRTVPSVKILFLKLKCIKIT